MYNSPFKILITRTPVKKACYKLIQVCSIFGVRDPLTFRGCVMAVHSTFCFAFFNNMTLLTMKLEVNVKVTCKWQSHSFVSRALNLNLVVRTTEINTEKVFVLIFNFCPSLPKILYLQCYLNLSSTYMYWVVIFMFLLIWRPGPGKWS